MKGIQDIITDKGVEALVQGVPSVFQIFFTGLQEIGDYRDFLKVDKEKYTDFARKLLKEGIWTKPEAGAHWFVSAAHTTEDIDRCLEEISKAIA